METYSRKRFKISFHPKTVMLMEQTCQDEGEKSVTAVAQSPLVGQASPGEPSSEGGLPSQEQMEGIALTSDMGNRIKQGFLFEIDHSHLPPTIPSQLRSIRVAMVCEKTDLSVAIRFPSMGSLRAFFNYSKRETHPALDEKFVMSCELAAKSLVRLVPSHVFSEEKSLESFWLVGSLHGEVRKDTDAMGREKKGTCLSVLKEFGMVNWGIRRQVKHIGKHMENDCSDGNAQDSSTSFVSEVAGSEKEAINVISVDSKEKCEDKDHQNEEVEKVVVVAEEEEVEEKEVVEEEEVEVEEDDGDDEGEEGEEEEEEEKEVKKEDEEESSYDNQENEDDHPEEKEVMEANGNLKRKRYSFRNLPVKKPKKEDKRKFKNKAKAKVKAKKQKARTRSKEVLIQRDPKGRWSAERYKLAEKNLLAVMRLKGATAEKPILRPQLRAEARKKIGDTGLLDHLLKHMAGKLAPGGQERFRRRHNPDGAMEYWLESAELVDIRKEAGVSDPYWVPPPGWKIGDSLNHDPVCARELKLLKDEVLQLRRQLELMATKVQLKEEVEKLWRELEKVNSGKKQEEYVATLISSLCNFGVALDSVENWNEQFMAISKFVEEMELVKNTLLVCEENKLSICQ